MASDLYTLNEFLLSDLSQFDLDSSILQTPIEETNIYSNFPCFEVKTEEENNKFVQRSFSSNNCFGENSGNYYSFDFNTSNNFQQQFSSSPENGFSNIGHMRKVCSTGDLQSMKKIEPGHQLSSSPLGTKSSYMEEANSIKVGRYSPEEKKERIIRYRAKRAHRNFNKTIKYTCRKTLADNRARIRGRFARNEESVDMNETAKSCKYDGECNLWIDGLNIEEDDGTMFNVLGHDQFIKYYGYS